MNQDTQAAVSAAIIAASHCLDARRYDEFGTWLAPDCELIRPTADEPLRGREAIVAAYRQTPAARVSRHLISNIQVTAETADRAQALSYVTLYSTEDGAATEQPTGAPVGRCLVGEFDDRWQRSPNGGWLLAHRRASFIFQLPLAEPPS